MGKPKMVTCHICGESVNKRHTYHIGCDRRACKKHEGVVEKMQELQEEDKKRKEEAKSKETANKIATDGMSRNPAKPRCWVCGLEGIDAREFYLKKLVAMEKIEITGIGPKNPFDPEHPFSKRTNQPVIFTQNAKKYPWMSKHLVDTCRGLMDMVGFFAICGDCMVKHKIDPPGPKLSLEQLSNLGVAYASTMKPAIKKRAQKEIIESN